MVVPQPPRAVALYSRLAFSLVGMLVTMVCMVVLFAILMNSMNKAVTGQGSQQANTVRSFEDKLYLMELYKSMLADARENKDHFITPARVASSKDPALNDTANLFSAMVMNQMTVPKQLISGNEYSGYVEEKFDYNFTAYNPAAKQFWDTTFKADLKKLSHVSYAHEPLCGERFERQWRSTMNSNFPLVGNRGPRDGVNDPNSMACGRDGVWRGHFVFGDGHIEFTETPTKNGLVLTQDGRNVPDNVFMMETGPDGDDAILSFTKSMTKEGPELQFD